MSFPLPHDASSGDEVLGQPIKFIGRVVHSCRGHADEVI
jgi:hypothetical protein